MTWLRTLIVSAALIGSAAVYLGLIISWYAETAGGATIAGVAVMLFFVSTLLSQLRSRWRRTALVAVSACLVAGCTGTSPAPSEPVVADARELDGPLTKLVIVDPVSGDTAVYDAVDETETAIGSYGATTAIDGDGRFAYLRTGEETTIVDAGAWTFDHGDHYHYFATDPAMVGTLDTPVASASASNSLVTVESTEGSTVVLDQEKLAEHTVEQADLSLGDDVTAAVPYGSRVVTVSGTGDMQVVGDDGATALDGACPNPTWSKVSRRAVVFGCDTGAVRVTGGDGDLTVTALPFPPDAPLQRPQQMDHRDRADVFAGVSPGTVWVLDSRQRRWTVIPVPDAVAANTAGDGTVLVLRRDGTLGSFDVNEGTETARVPLFAGGVPDQGPEPVVDLDSDRAYINNAGAHEIYEIDYAGGLRIARTLRTEVAPGLMVEAGR